MRRLLSFPTRSQTYFSVQRAPRFEYGVVSLGRTCIESAESGAIRKRRRKQRIWAPNVVVCSYHKTLLRRVNADSGAIRKKATATKDLVPKLCLHRSYRTRHYCGETCGHVESRVGTDGTRDGSSSILGLLAFRITMWVNNGMIRRTARARTASLSPLKNSNVVMHLRKEASGLKQINFSPT